MVVISLKTMCYICSTFFFNLYFNWISCPVMLEWINWSFIISPDDTMIKTTLNVVNLKNLIFVVSFRKELWIFLIYIHFIKYNGHIYTLRIKNEKYENPCQMGCPRWRVVGHKSKLYVSTEAFSMVDICFLQLSMIVAFVIYNFQFFLLMT